MFEVALFVLNGYAFGKLTVFQIFSPFVRSGGGALIYVLIFMTAGIIYAIVRWGSSRERGRAGFVVAVTAVLVVILIASGRQLGIRAVERVPQTDNDGAMQTRIAAAALLRLQNPYDLDFRTTEFGWFPSPRGEGYDNLAADHYAYLPMQFLLMVPAVAAERLFAVQIDTQTIYVVLLLVYAVAVSWLGRNWTQRTRLWLLTAGNAWFLFLAFGGFNDIVFVLFITLAGIFVWKKWMLEAGLVLGLAMAAKQTAWIALPVWIALCWSVYRSAGIRVRLKYAATPLLLAGVILAPFFIWNPGAFLDDTLRYVSGAIPFTYPISGNTFLQYARVLGLTRSPWDAFPAWPFVGAVAIPMLIIMWRSIARIAHASRFVAWTAVMYIAIVIWSRFAPDNYFLAASELLVAAYGLTLAEGSHGEDAKV